MPANPSLIDTVSQVLLNNLPTYGQQRDIARKVLQALLEARPTPGMVRAGQAEHPAHSVVMVKDIFAAMLRAALEEADNHG